MAGAHYNEPARAVSAGVILPGASLALYAASTLNKVEVYAGRLPTIKLPNPMTADSAGRFPSFWIDPDVSYRAILTFNGATVYDSNPLTTFPGSTDDTPLDENGRPMPFATRTFWLSRTTELAPIYTSSGLTTPLTNPQTADANGVFTPAYLDDDIVYRTKLEKRDGTLVYDVDFPLVIPPPVFLSPLFVAGRSDTFNSIMTSPDGITWEMQPAPLGMGVLGLAYSPELHLLVSVGGTAPYSSPDAVTWTPRTNPSGAFVWQDVTWSPALNLFCAIGYGASGAMTSPDGINWTVRTTPDRSWACIRWSPQLGLFAAGTFINLGFGNIQSVMTSPDGINWTQRNAEGPSLGFGFQFYKMVIDPATGYFYASTRAQFAMMKSTDGLTWTSISTGIGGSACTDVDVDSAGKVVMPRIGGDHNFAISLNAGATWANTVNGDWCEDICYSPALARWVGVCNANAVTLKKAIYSSDGTNWSDGVTPALATSFPSWDRVIYVEL